MFPLKASKFKPFIWNRLIDLVSIFIALFFYMQVLFQEIYSAFKYARLRAVEEWESRKNFHHNQYKTSENSKGD